MTIDKLDLKSILSVYKALISMLEGDDKLKYLKILCCTSKYFFDSLSQAELFKNFIVTTTLTSFNKQAESVRTSLTFLSLIKPEQREPEALWESEAQKKNFKEVLKYPNICHLRVPFSKELYDVKVLMELLEQNPTITELYLYDDTPLHRRCFDGLSSLWKEVGIGELLKNNKAIKVLDLSGTNVREDSLNGIAESLDSNTTLTSLNLSNNGLMPGDIIKLLSKKNAIKTLDLSSNCIEPRFYDQRVIMASFLEALKKSQLTQLDLSNNKLFLHDSNTTVADVIRENTTIKELSLARTYIHGHHLDDLVKALAVNKTLEQLDLSNNDLANKASVIVGILESNSTLKRLFIGGNNIPRNLATAIATAAVERRNKRNPIKFDSQPFEIRSAASYLAALRDELCTKIWQHSSRTIKYSLIISTLLGIGVGVGSVMFLWPLMICGKALAILYSVGIVVTLCADTVLYSMSCLLIADTLFTAASKNDTKELGISQKDMRFYAFVAFGALLGSNLR